jgi:hypothetical protein
MKLRKIAALVGGAALAISLMGAGVGAVFTSTATTYQQITVESMVLHSSPQYCTPGLVATSSGSVSCTVELWATGGIVPTSFTMTPSIDGSSTGLHEAGKWVITDNATPQYTALNVLGTFAYGTFTNYGTITYTITWSDLGNPSMGDMFYVDFNFIGSN